MKKYFEKINFLFNSNKIITSFLFSCFIVGISLVFLPFRFEENDDVIMLLLASGNYTGNFESNLIFINPIYGGLVAFLYKSIKGIEWYTFLFIVTNQYFLIYK